MPTIYIRMVKKYICLNRVSINEKANVAKRKQLVILEKGYMGFWGGIIIATNNTSEII